MNRLSESANSIAVLLKQRRETVAVAESSTGGLISAALLAVPGASAYFVGGGVIYTKAAREALLGIDMGTHPDLRPSTEAYATLVANTMRDRLGATWGLSETGAAGPSGNRYGDQAGHSCIALAGPLSQSTAIETGQTNREENMRLFAAHALEVLLQVLRSAA
ncbi:MAG: CinA family protein [Gammaproteobacteria bacterium]